jgi:putative endonuclease
MRSPVQSRSWAKSRDKVRFWVYVLRSKIADRYYIGSTQDIEKRLNEHNTRKRTWTNRFRPWELIHAEEFPTRSDAVKREKELKSKTGIKEKFMIIKRAGLAEHP